jgi:hypothetical protein
MNYLLITPKGRVYTFYIKAVALSYQRAYGGTISVVSMQQKTLQAGQVFRKSLTDSVEPV